jgi:multidrug/hemolysin transport system ATP-binding protein
MYTRVSRSDYYPIAQLSDALTSILDHFRQNMNGFEVLNGTMDDAFIGITGKEIRE